MSTFEPIVPYRGEVKDAGKEFVRQDKEISRWFFAEFARPLLAGQMRRSDLRRCCEAAGIIAYLIEYMDNYIVIALFPKSGAVRQIVILGAGFGTVTDMVKREMQLRLEDYLQ